MSESISYPRPSLWVRLVQAIKDALSQKPITPNRAERRKASRFIGAKRSDGKFRGNPSLKAAIKEYKLQREVHRG
jgi:hypothetical protein